MARFGPALIRRYYDRHTSAFVSLGQGGALGTLHRAVWGPGIATRAQAFRYVEDRIAEAIDLVPPAEGPRHVVDLGCGVGSSLCYLAGRLPIAGTGVTVSPAQVALARRAIESAGLSDRVTVIEGDYASLPEGIPPADLAFAIESFVHAPDPLAFFLECARSVRRAGLLVICDDFLRSTSGWDRDATIDRFCSGWHVNTLIDNASLARLADMAGFDQISATDLSRYLELGRPRDRAIAVAAAIARCLPWRWPRADPWVGGTALQTCLRRGWIGYDLVVLRRR
jgi:tocopherol O-methyltransferase